MSMDNKSNQINWLKDSEDKIIQKYNSGLAEINTEELLFKAVRRGYTKLIGELFGFLAEWDTLDKKGVEVKTKGKWKWMNYDIDINNIEKLIIAGIDPTKKDSANLTMLHYAVRKNDIELAELLIGCYPNLINVKDDGGNTILHYAVRKGCCEKYSENSSDMDMLELLFGCNPKMLNAKNYAGNTPLHVSLHNKPIYGDPLYTDTALEKLIELGANVNIRNNEGNTIMDMKHNRNLNYIIHNSEEYRADRLYIEELIERGNEIPNLYSNYIASIKRSAIENLIENSPEVREMYLAATTERKTLCDETNNVRKVFAGDEMRQAIPNVTLRLRARRKAIKRLRERIKE